MPTRYRRTLVDVALDAAVRWMARKETPARLRRGPAAAGIRGAPVPVLPGIAAGVLRRGVVHRVHRPSPSACRTATTEQEP
jgi:hypothetical protein